MKSTTTAVRYAKALLDLSIESGKFENIAADVNLILSATKEHEFNLLLASPIVKADKKISIFKELFGAKIDAISLNFLTLVTNKHREDSLQNILEEYKNLYNKHKGIQLATVITASGLDDTLRKKVYEIIKNSVKSEIEVVEKIDPAIIGGFILKMGSTQIDSSVLRSIRNLKQSLS